MEVRLGALDPDDDDEDDEEDDEEDDDEEEEEGEVVMGLNPAGELFLTGGDRKDEEHYCFDSFIMMIRIALFLL